MNPKIKILMYPQGVHKDFYMKHKELCSYAGIFKGMRTLISQESKGRSSHFIFLLEYEGGE